MKNIDFKNVTLLMVLFSVNSWAITNGIETVAYAPVIKLTDSLKKYTCAGTIVGRRPLTVLTATHCLRNLDDGGLNIDNEESRVKVLDDTGSPRSSDSFDLSGGSRNSLVPEFGSFQSFGRVLDELNGTTTIKNESIMSISFFKKDFSSTKVFVHSKIRKIKEQHLAALGRLAEAEKEFLKANLEVDEYYGALSRLNGEEYARLFGFLADVDPALLKDPEAGAESNLFLSVQRRNQLKQLIARKKVAKQLIEDRLVKMQTDEPLDLAVVVFEDVPAAFDRPGIFVPLAMLAIS